MGVQSSVSRVESKGTRERTFVPASGSESCEDTFPISAWLIPVCAVLCGICFAGERLDQAQSVVSLLLTAFLAGPLLGFTNFLSLFVCIRGHTGREDANAARSIILPYTVPRSPAAHLARLLQRIRTLWGAQPRWGGVNICSIFLLSLALSLIAAALLDEWVLLLCLVSVALTLLLGIVKVAGEQDAGALLLSSQTVLAWLIGRTVTSSIRVVTVALATLFGASLWALLTSVANRNGSRLAIVHLTHWLVAVILIVANRPIGAGVILIVWIGHLLLHMVSFNAETYIRRARWLLVIGMIAASAAATGWG